MSIKVNKQKKFVVRRFTALAIVSLAVAGGLLFYYMGRHDTEPVTASGYVTAVTTEGFSLTTDGGETIGLVFKEGSTGQMPAEGDAAEVVYQEIRTRKLNVNQIVSYTLKRLSPEAFYSGVYVSSSDGKLVMLDSDEDNSVSFDVSQTRNIPEYLEPGDEIFVISCPYYEGETPAAEAVIRNVELFPLGVDVPDDEAADPYALKDGDVTEKGFKVRVINGVTYIDGVLIANKTYRLPKEYNPAGLTKDFRRAFEQMVEGAAKDGISLREVSGYRDFEVQYVIYHRYVARDGVDEADTYSARPGHSEHQSGLAMDINSLKVAWGDTREGIWLAEHCHEYGFIIRYPKGKSSITGYIYEPWHARYVGVHLATALYESGLTLEEYFGIDSEYAERRS